MRNQLGKRRLIRWTGNSQFKESSLPAGSNGAGAPEFTLDPESALTSGTVCAWMRCPAIHELNKRTRTTHLRIATFFATEWALGAFIHGALSVPETRALAIIQIRGHQELSNLLSIRSLTNVEIRSRFC